MHRAELLFHRGVSEFKLEKLKEALDTLTEASGIDNDRKEIHEWINRVKREIVKKDFDNLIGKK